MEKLPLPHLPDGVLRDTAKRFIADETKTPKEVNELIISLIETHINVYTSVYHVRRQLESAGLESNRIEKLIVQALRNIANKLDK